MIYVFLANGFEEVEALTPVDVLRRAEKEVITVAVGTGSSVVTGAHGIPVLADIPESEIQLNRCLEMIVLPGGMPGTLNLEKSEAVGNAINYCIKNDIWVGAICAAPSILGRKGLLQGRNAVCFEGFESQLFGANVLYDSVCADGKFITARGAGVALEFSLKLTEVLTSSAESERLGAAMQCRKK